MDIIKAPKKVFPIPLIRLYNNKNEDLGEFDYWQYLDARAQIAEKRLEGYYTKHVTLEGEEMVINIDSLGRVDKWDENLFQQSSVLDLTRRIRDAQNEYNNF